MTDPTRRIYLENLQSCLIKTFLLLSASGQDLNIINLKVMKSLVELVNTTFDKGKVEEVILSKYKHFFCLKGNFFVLAAIYKI